MSVGNSVGTNLGNSPVQGNRAVECFPPSQREGENTPLSLGKMPLGNRWDKNSQRDSVGTALGNSAEQKTAEHKARLLADPRFAGWVAGAAE